ncbi:hypothetical protein U1Q18_022485 [Sarracenia purpurea var. burkii]
MTELGNDPSIPANIQYPTIATTVAHHEPEETKCQTLSEDDQRYPRQITNQENQRTRDRDLEIARTTNKKTRGEATKQKPGEHQSRNPREPNKDNREHKYEPEENRRSRTRGARTRKEPGTRRR